MENRSPVGKQSPKTAKSTRPRDKKDKKHLPTVAGIHFAISLKIFLCSNFSASLRKIDQQKLNDTQQMAKLKLEYLWLDGYTPVANLRGKTKIADGDPSTFSLEDCPMGLRRQLYNAGRRKRLRLPSQTGRTLSRLYAHKRLPRYV